MTKLIPGKLYTVEDEPTYLIECKNVSDADCVVGNIPTRYAVRIAADQILLYISKVKGRNIYNDKYTYIKLLLGNQIIYIYNSWRDHFVGVK